MSLTRLVFILAVVVIVLPTDQEEQQRLYDKVTGTTAWAMTFCERNGATCTAAGEAWTTFVKKAEFGAKLAGEMLRKHVMKGEREGEVAPASYSPGSPPPQRLGYDMYEPRPLDSRGTLTERDRAPTWRGALAGQPN